jgi:hypothetical protein
MTHYKQLLKNYIKIFIFCVQKTTKSLKIIILKRLQINLKVNIKILTN